MNAQAQNTTHTPGPWRFDAGWGAVVYGGTGSQPEGLITPTWASRKAAEPAEWEANARLIAAAPDLLAACVDAEKIVRRFIAIQAATGIDTAKPAATAAALQAAIARATGKGDK